MLPVRIEYSLPPLQKQSVITNTGENALIYNSSDFGVLLYLLWIMIGLCIACITWHGSVNLINLLK